MAHVNGSVDVETPSRRERAAIAAQACQTCRSRKSKCDEQRPKCSLCLRLSIECQYREPLPRKKDKTMTQILDALHRLESKFDNLSPSVQSTQSDGDPNPVDGASNGLSVPAKQLSAAHKVIVWPSVYLHLVNRGSSAVADLQNILQKGTPWLIRQGQELVRPWSATACLQSVAIKSLDGTPSSRVSFPWLSIQQIQSYTEAYFHTFNVISPILNEEEFTNNVLTPLLRDGYGFGDTKSVLALQVYALGQLAVEGTLDRPITTTVADGKVSGLRGGSIEHPPGLEIFNEARKRIGFLNSEATIEGMQCFLLQAMYYQANASHLDFWRSTTAASMALQSLLQIEDYEWSSFATDVVKRAYWICHLNESLCRFDLCLPQTGIQALQHLVPPPPSPSHDESPQSMNSSWSNDERSHHHQHHNQHDHQHHFHAVLNLEKLINEIQLDTVEPTTASNESAIGFQDPSLPVIREMARQLESWRSLLPRRLQWLDGEKLDFPSTDYGNGRASEQLFAADQGAIPVRHRYNLDISVAYLRTRFYYAKYLLYQPFIYKVLHFPELLIKDDIDCAAMALRSACLWPMSMAPPKDKKRLVPFLFLWTQDFISMLLVLEMTRVNATLRSICEEHVDGGQVQQTVALLLDWLQDVKQIDGVAAWSWGLVKPLFSA